MALSMKERNDEKAWAAYEKAGKKLMAEVMEKRKAVEKKYKDHVRPQYGLDGDPEARELKEINKWFGEEIKKLQNKHGIK